MGIVWWGECRGQAVRRMTGSVPCRGDALWDNETGFEAGGERVVWTSGQGLSRRWPCCSGETEKRTTPGKDAGCSWGAARRKEECGGSNGQEWVKDPQVAVAALRAEGSIDTGDAEKQFLPGLFGFFRWRGGADLSVQQLFADPDRCLARGVGQKSIVADAHESGR